MCIHLFNPPAPGCQPESSAGPEYRPYGRCGDCFCLSKHWQLDVIVPDGPIDFSAWSGHFVLERRLAINQLDARCVWLAPPVNTHLATESSDNIVGCPWMLIFNYYPDPFIIDGAGLEWWIGKWTLHAGGFAWNVDQLANELPGVNILRPDLANWNGLSAYLHEGWDINQPFRCLNPNRFVQVDTVYSAFPFSVTVRPYWP